MNSFTVDSTLAAAVAPSPNHDERLRGIDMILLHYTGMETAQAAFDRLRDPQARVSSHYMIYEDGRIVQLVPEARRAWHAGVSSWMGQDDINSCSIGIEIVNPGHDFGYPDFPKVQIVGVIALCHDVIARHKIPAARILAHSDVAPSRKQDPGEKFPWDTLAQAGVGIWLEPTAIVAGPELDPGDQGEVITKLQASLAEFGYGVGLTGEYDQATTDAVTAFQRHYRPSRVDGFADHSTMETLKRLLAQTP